MHTFRGPYAGPLLGAPVAQPEMEALFVELSHRFTGKIFKTVSHRRKTSAISLDNIQSNRLLCTAKFHNNRILFQWLPFSLIP